MKRRMKKLMVAFVAFFGMTVGALAPAVSIEAKGGTINDTPDYYAIQSDVTLTGSGTGYHAKLAYVSRGAAISYGIQHDEFASAPYTGRDELMVENVFNNGAGGQNYDWLGVTLNPGQTYRLMLTLTKSGQATVYLDGQPLRTYQNDGLKTVESGDANEYLANPLPRVEGSGRLNGDTVDARFSNIQLKEGKYRNFKKYPPTNANARSAEPGKKYPFFVANKVKSNLTLSISTPAKNEARISGAISGLAPGMDWDSAYEAVSGIVQFGRDAMYFPPEGHPDHI